MSKVNKQKTIISLFTVISLLVIVLYNLFFSNDISSSRFVNPKDLLQVQYHGVLTNHTDHPIRFADFRTIITLGPGESSDKVDVDGVIIDRPTLINHVQYTHGVFKFCDFTSIEIISEGKMDFLRPSWGHFLCQALGDYNHYDTLSEAFPFPQY